MSLVTEQDLIQSLMANTPDEEAKASFARAREAAGIPAKEAYEPAEVIAISSMLLNELQDQAYQLFEEIEASLK